MKKKITPLIILFFFIISFSFYSQELNESDQLLISSIDTSLVKLLKIQQEIKDIHPFLEDLQPIAIFNDENLFIFDVDSLSGHYKFIKKTPVPFPLVKNIRASLPLSSYDGRPTCIVTDDAFNTIEDYTIIFHEFIHCSQAKTIEFQLKSKLDIHQTAMKNNDYMWELNHPFPYTDSSFVNYYSGFLSALKNNNKKEVVLYRTKLKRLLNKNDFEYMVWQEWKEGFARLIENRLRNRYHLIKNEYGKDEPFNRISFYNSGEKYINFLVQNNEELFINLGKLFDMM